MEKKYELKNNGIPLFVNTKDDLPAHGTDLLESWYINCTFEDEGKKFGFVWHQQYVDSPVGKLHSVEFLVMDKEADTFYSNGYSAKEDETHFSATDKLYVSSSYGTLTGDDKTMKLNLKTPNTGISVSCDVGDEIFNGTTGLLNMAGNSYQYAFPNMQINGELIIEGKAYQICHAKAWFDRQWTKKELKNTEMKFSPASFEEFTQSWIWIGMPTGEHGALSFWDVYTNIEGRHCFMTIRKENGIQMNVPVKITYKDIWKSNKTGSSYPNQFTIEIPEEEIKLTYTSLIGDPEFHHDGDGIHGCQCFCSVEGVWNGEPIHTDCVVEMVGNVCGEV